MKNPLRHLRFDASAFLNDEHVAKMNAGGRGVYISALCWAWLEGSIPDDPAALAPLVRLSPKDVKREWPTIRDRFTARDDGRLIHHRLEADRAEALERYGRAIESGKRGGHASAATRRGDEHDRTGQGTLKAPLSQPQGTLEPALEGSSRVPQPNQIKSNQSQSNSTASSDAATDAAADSSRDDETKLLALLSRENVAATKRVRELVRQYPERVRPQIEMLQYRRDLKNRPAALIQAIEEDWPRPAGMTSDLSDHPDFQDPPRRNDGTERFRPAREVVTP